MTAKITDLEYLAAIERAGKVYGRVTDPIFAWYRVFRTLARQERDAAYDRLSLDEAWDAADRVPPRDIEAAFSRTLDDLKAQLAALTAHPSEMLTAAQKSAADTYEMLWGVRP
jgi:hypothetical protein